MVQQRLPAGNNLGIILSSFRSRLVYSNRYFKSFKRAHGIDWRGMVSAAIVQVTFPVPMCPVSSTCSRLDTLEAIGATQSQC